jgi:hypothetical protein
MKKIVKVHQDANVNFNSKPIEVAEVLQLWIYKIIRGSIIQDIKQVSMTQGRE